MPFEPAVPLSSPAPVGAPPVTVGSLIGRTFSTWWKRMWIFAALSLVVLVPVYVVQFAVLLPMQRALSSGEPAPGFMVVALSFSFLASLAMMVQSCGHTYGAVQHLSGMPVRVGAMLGVAFGRLLPMIGLFLVGLLAYFAFGITVVLTAVLLGMVLGKAITGFLLAVVLLPLCCVLGTALSLTIPVIVAERVGPITGMRRSWVLTKGRRGAIFLTLLVAALFLLAIFGVQFALMFSSGAMALGGLEPQLEPAMIVRTVVFGLVYVLVLPIFTAAPAVAYHDVRIEKEGVSSEKLAEVFQ